MHAGTPTFRGKAESTLGLRASNVFRSSEVEPIRESLRAGIDSRQGGRRLPSSVEDRDRAAGRCRPPRRLGKADRALSGLSPRRPAPVAGCTLALDLAARPVRGVICKRRLIPRLSPWTEGPRRHAALGLLAGAVSAPFLPGLGNRHEESLGIGAGREEPTSKRRSFSLDPHHRARFRRV